MTGRLGNGRQEASKSNTSNEMTHLLQGFYEEVASPLLLEVDLRYPENAVDSLTTNHYSQLFNGSEIVVAGRLIDNDLDNFMVEVFAQGVRRRKCWKCRDTGKMLCVYYLFITLDMFSPPCSLMRTLKCRARPVLRIGMCCTQMRSTSLGISQSICGPTSPSSSYWRQGL